MAQTAAQKKAAALALLKKAEAALKRAQAADDNSSEIAATARRRAVIDTAPTPEPAPVVSNTPKLDAVKAATAARVAADAALKESSKPKDLDNPPAGTYYQWHVFAGGGGEWRLIKIPGYDPEAAENANYTGSGTEGDPFLYKGKPFTGSKGYGDYVNGILKSGSSSNINVLSGNGKGTLTSTTNPLGSSTNITVLKSLLKGMGFNSSIIDSSTSFLMSLLSEGLDYDNAVSIFLDSKDYTLKSNVKITSPFYEQYGYLNEGMTNAKSASELYNFVEGSKGIIEKYGLSNKFLSQDSLKKYVKNNVTAKDLDERANAARLKAINADPLYVQSLKMLGYLGSNADLTDFYLDPAIGKEKLETNRSTGAFTAEALRRANAGIKTDREDMMRFEKLTAGLQAKGLTEAEISQTASTGFQNIANTLQPEVALSNIFEGANAANAQTIQTELEAEEFLGLDSARRKKLKELGTNIMQAKTGMSTGRTVSYSNYSSAGQI